LALRRRRYRRAFGWFRVLTFAAIACVIAAALGFIAFADTIARTESQTAESADGIVVLTGGASRIDDAIGLLVAGRGKRLLISGVNPSTTENEIARVNPESERLLACCIDLGHEATNTLGNAVETGRWARERKIGSLIVVTSGWHMPRALVELEKELPDVRLISYPVISDRMREDPWWADLPTVRLLFIEYVKYLASVVRVRLDLARGAADTATRRA
jgi:uncharacterized SAM-binding protein YcdF (DUF218 family)